jgi:hypothetical protein
VVDLAVLALVGADVQQQVAHRALALGHRPVLDRDVGRVHLLPQRQAAGVEIGDLARVGDDGFFEVADEAVAGAWGDEVGGEHEVEEESGWGFGLVAWSGWLIGSSRDVGWTYPWAPRTMTRMKGPGSAILRKVSRCMRSL